MMNANFFSVLADVESWAAILFGAALVVTILLNERDRRAYISATEAGDDESAA